MNHNTEKPLAHARQDQLVIKEMPNELLVYDLKSHQAHCLNQIAALVWGQCDGATSSAEIAKHLAEKLNTQFDENLVWFALEQLSKANLLRENVERPVAITQLSRRRLLKKFGSAAMLSIPLIMSLTAPAAAAAATQPCIPESQCNATNICNPCHKTGSNDCTKVCRANKDDGKTIYQCVGVPAGTC